MRKTFLLFWLSAEFLVGCARSEPGIPVPDASTGPSPDAGIEPEPRFTRTEFGSAVERPGAPSVGIERGTLVVVRGTEYAVLMETATLEADGQAIGAPQLDEEEHEDSRVVLPRGEHLSEWYLPRHGGLEQGWTFSEPAPGNVLSIEMRLGQDVAVVATSDEALDLEVDEIAVRYFGLSASDGTGNSLPSRMEVVDRVVHVEVDATGAEYPVTIDPLVIAIAYPLTLPSDGSHGALFGSSSATDSTSTSALSAVIGEPDQPSSSTNQLVSGAAHIYLRNGSASGVWQLSQSVRMLPTAGRMSESFGASVDLHGNWVAVGAPLADFSRGAFYVFDRTWGVDSNGVPLVYLSQRGDTSAFGLGTQIAMSGTRIVVATNPISNRVLVYNRTSFNLTLDQVLTGTGLFGNDVDVDPSNPNLIVVGAPGVSPRGAVYVYRRGTSTWALERTITPVSTNHSQFGITVAVSSGRIAIGCIRSDNNRAELVIATPGPSWPISTVIASAGELTTKYPIQYAIPDRQPWTALSPDGAVRLLGFPNAQRVPADGWQYGEVAATGPAGLPWTTFVSGTTMLKRGTSVATDGRTVLMGYQSTGAASAGAVRVIDLRSNNGSTCSSPSECASGFCADGFCCNTACNSGTCDACSYAAGGSTDGACTPIRSALLPRTCRSSIGSCDLAEVCSASDTSCPVNRFVDSSVVCRPRYSSAELCGAAETCTGSSGLCPADIGLPAGTICRQSYGACDPAETCLGGANMYCPSNTRSTEVCRPAVPPCDVAEWCDGAHDACPVDAFIAAGVQCRPAEAGGCGAAESCTGASADCPADHIAPPGTVCRGAVGSPACDLRSSCSGGGGVCDQPELCDGSTPACPVADTTMEICSGADVRTSLGAPPIVPGGFGANVRFLYEGAGAPQSGVTVGIIEPRRAAVLFGYVRNRAGAGLTGATVRVPSQPGVGHTLTSNGRFDLVVNGGGPLTIEVTHSDSGGRYLKVQRTVSTDWNDYFAVQPIVLIHPDPSIVEVFGEPMSSPTVSFPTTAPQLVRAPTVSDGNGSRHASLFFPAGVAAQAHVGAVRSDLTGPQVVRATEFTVGPSGPAAMPGELPRASAYTYALELSVDEAVDADRVTFTGGLPVLYVDNFLEAPVASGVPVGWYDRVSAGWQADNNGRVISLVGESGGVALIDLDGNGTAESTSTLRAAGISADEEVALARGFDSTPTVPISIWRVPVAHFTPWDCNWPYAIAGGELPDFFVSRRNRCWNWLFGSIINCENQTLGEVFPIGGSDLNLHYSSARSRGLRDSFRALIPIVLPDDPTVRSFISDVRVLITIAGNQYTYSLGQNPETNFTFDWDGLDAYGRESSGETRGIAQVCFDYNATRVATPADGVAFGEYLQNVLDESGGTGMALETDSGRGSAALCRTRDFSLGIPDVESFLGLQVDAVHSLDREGNIFRGDGSERRRAAGGLGTIDTMVDGTSTARRTDGTPSLSDPARGFRPRAMAIAPDGSLVLAYDAAAGPQLYSRIVRLSGTDVTHIAGAVGDGTYTGQTLAEMDATEVARTSVRTIQLGTIRDIEIARDGSIYILEYTENDTVVVIRRILLDRIERVAGGAAAPFSSPGGDGDGGPARLARFGGDLRPTRDLAIGPDGSLYVADRTTLRHFTPPSRDGDPDGIIRSVLRGDSGTSGAASVCDAAWVATTVDGLGRTVAQPLRAYPMAVSVTPTGDVLVGFRTMSSTGGANRGCLASLGVDGRPNQLTRSIPGGAIADGTDAMLYGGGEIRALAANREGIVFRDNTGVRVLTDGRIFSLAIAADPATPAPSYFDHELAVVAGLEYTTYAGPLLLASGPGGALGISSCRSTGSDGACMAHILVGGAAEGILDTPWRHDFDADGHLLETTDAVTGAVLRTIERTAGRVRAITDANGNRVELQWGANCTSGLITRPGSVRFVPPPGIGPSTDVRDTDCDGWADVVEYVGTGHYYGLTYRPLPGPRGMLISDRDPYGRTHTFTYGPWGRLSTDTPPSGRTTTLLQHLPEINEVTGSVTQIVDYATALGRILTHRSQSETSGELIRRVTARDETGGGTALYEERRSLPPRERMPSDPPGALVRETSLRASDGAISRLFETLEVDPGADRALGRESAPWADALPARQDTTLPGVPALSIPSRTVSREVARARVYHADGIDREVTTIIDRAGTTSRSRVVTIDPDRTATGPAFTTTVRQQSQSGALWSETVFDYRQRPVRQRAPGVADTLLTYDSRGRVSEVSRVSTEGFGTRTTRMLSYVDSTVGELSAPTETQTGGDAVTTFDWTSYWRLGSVTQGGATTTRQYDSYDRVDGITPPGRLMHSFQWSTADEVSAYVPPLLSGEAPPGPGSPRNAQLSYHFDDEGRPTHTDLGSTPLIHFDYRRTDGVYAANGIYLGRVGHGIHLVTYQYDPASGALSSLQTEEGLAESIVRDGSLPVRYRSTGFFGRTYDIDIGYGALLEPQSVTHPGVAGGTVVASFGRDVDGAVSCVRVGGSIDASCTGGLRIATTLEPVSPDPLRGTRTSIGALSTEESWSDLGEATYRNATWPGGGLAIQYAERESVGRLWRVAETSVGSAAIARSYLYDSRGRLTDVWSDTARTALVEQYRYDSNGIRTLARAPGRPTLASADIEADTRDRVTRYGAVSFTYNDLGQRLTRTEAGVTATYEYDALGALRSVLRSAPHPFIEYQIDAAGRRRTRRVGGVVQRGWIYSGSAPVVELDGSGNVRAIFVYGEGRVPSLMVIPTGVTGAGTYRLIVDHLGSIRRVVNVATGAVVQSRDYDSFGRVTSESGDAFFQPFGFAGGMYDPDTGLVRFGARDYDPLIGQWTAPDPLLFGAGDGNLYAYVGNDPVNHIDPTGLIVDTLVDAGFILDDIHRLFNGDCDELGLNLLMLGADVVSAVVPGVTGGGQMVHAAAVGGHAVGAAAAHAAGAGMHFTPTQILATNARNGRWWENTLAAQYAAWGYTVERQVYRRTLLGRRYVDMELSLNGALVHRIEAKYGNAVRSIYQRVQDALLERADGVATQVQRWTP